MKLFTRVVRAGLLCGVADGLFSSVLTLLYRRTVTRLFQGVAATAFGPSMFDGGLRTALLGLAMHFGVALTWSAIFLVLVMRSSRLRRVLDTRFGMLEASAVYGPGIWMVMSLGVIPLLSHQPVAITWRWWVQFFGHIAFVAMPIVWSIAPVRDQLATHP